MLFLKTINQHFQHLDIIKIKNYAELNYIQFQLN